MRTSVSCTKDFFNLLKELKQKTGISKSKIIELAVTEWARTKLLEEGK